MVLLLFQERVWSRSNIVTICNYDLPFQHLQLLRWDVHLPTHAHFLSARVVTYILCIVSSLLMITSSIQIPSSSFWTFGSLVLLFEDIFHLFKLIHQVKWYSLSDVRLISFPPSVQPPLHCQLYLKALCLFFVQYPQGSSVLP